MAQLQRTRLGWENEHLAKFLLSKIAFIANPVTVSDDIGTDLICTLFEQRSRPNKKGKGKTEMLFPLNAFAIQIKTDPKAKPLKSITLKRDNVESLLSLQLPFFVGVINRKKSSLAIYSGEFIPLMFSMHGGPDRVRSVILHLRDLIPADYGTQPTKYIPKFYPRRHTCDLVMPPVSTLTTRMEARDQQEPRAAILERCNQTLENIASRISNEFIFKGRKKPDGKPAIAIVAGSGSAKHFRENFRYRLAEAFYNLEWAYKNLGKTKGKKDGFRKEFRAFEKCYLELRKVDATLPKSIVGIVYKRVKPVFATKRKKA